MSISEELAARYRERGVASVVIPNGCDDVLFAGTDAAPLPDDVRLPPPIAGFVGHLAERIDVALLEAVAERGHSLLLVGPRSRMSSSCGAWSGCSAVRTSSGWDRSPSAQLPSYLRVMDVGLVPYADSAFNRASFPLKTLEYLAAGRAVVATDLPAMRWLDTDLIGGPRTRGLRRCGRARAGAERTPALVAARRAFAARHGWDRRAAEFAEAIGLPVPGTMDGGGPLTAAIGVSWGDPGSARTYSGVPWRLFGELERRGVLVGVPTPTRPERRTCWSASWTGAEASPRGDRASTRCGGTCRRTSRASRGAFGPCRPSSRRTTRCCSSGSPGLPAPGIGLVAHIEIPVRTAIATPVYASSYGFADVPSDMARRAIAGERMFVDACSLVWTNSDWTAACLVEAGVAAERLRVWPPPCGVEDPGELERDWDRCALLFLGKDWDRKGGPLLIEAFRRLQRARPDATLTIIGCDPPVGGEGVRVLGFLDQRVPAQAQAIRDALTAATDLLPAVGLGEHRAGLPGGRPLRAAGRDAHRPGP